MVETRISANGQIVIPSGIRKKAGITAGTEFDVYNDREGNIVLIQIKPEEIKKKIEEIKKGIQ